MQLALGGSRWEGSGFAKWVAGGSHGHCQTERMLSTVNYESFHFPYHSQFQSPRSLLWPRCCFLGYNSWRGGRRHWSLCWCWVWCPLRERCTYRNRTRCLCWWVGSHGHRSLRCNFHHTPHCPDWTHFSVAQVEHRSQWELQWRMAPGETWCLLQRS